MKFAAQYVNTATNFIEKYDGSVPLHHYLKAEFSINKKYGSKDRKVISELCYAYFRLGHFLQNIDIVERIKVAVFLMGLQQWKILFEENWLTAFEKDLSDRITFIEAFYHQSIHSIFPWIQELSEPIDQEKFVSSHLIQPNLFIRIRPGKQTEVKKKLMQASIEFVQVNTTCLAFKNATKLDDVLELNKEYVVQDLSSQKVGELLTDAADLNPLNVWDCCAASGGKAIMVKDIFPGSRLTVSDVRPSILQNLKGRFKEASINNYSSLTVDLSKPSNTIPNSPFDLIICDAPCSGSGTWGRTPEQLYFFKHEEIERYSKLQKEIAKNTIPFIKRDGFFLYVTCSVFQKENDGVVDFLVSACGLTLITLRLLKGYDQKADTMFAALLKKVE